MENGEDEEEENLDESMDEEKQPIQMRKKLLDKQPEGRAPTMTIEAVRIGRPLKVLSLLSSVATLLLFTMSAACTSWLYTKQNRMGLFQDCELFQFTNNKDSSSNVSPCNFTVIQTWERCTSAILASTSILFTSLGVILLISGILTLAVNCKTKLYKAVLIIYPVASLLMIAALLMLPITTYYNLKDVKQSNIEEQEQILTIGWSYITTGVGVLTLVVAIILLASDRKADEIAYRESICRASTCEEPNRK